MPANAEPGIEVALRIEVLNPPPGVAFAMQIRHDGLAKDGGPSCATVPLLDRGWHPD
jgi:hypothetical protein